jgi:hypothetical protein
MVTFGSDPRSKGTEQWGRDPIRPAATARSDPTQRAADPRPTPHRPGHVRRQGSGHRGNEFNGKIRWVQLTVDEASSDYLVHPEDRLRVIMARQ